MRHEGLYLSDLWRRPIKAAARVSEDLKGRHPQVPWPHIIAFRNILIHAYFGIEWNVVENDIWLQAVSQ